MASPLKDEVVQEVARVSDEIHAGIDILINNAAVENARLHRGEVMA